jgi:hypothetical protein
MNDVLEAINSIVDLATGLTSAEMKIAVNVKEVTLGLVQKEFTPSFCPVYNSSCDSK